MLHLTDWMTTAQRPFYSKIADEKHYYMHDHSFFEIFYVLDGTIIHDFKGKKEILQRGDCFFLLPEDVHNFNRTPEHHAKHRDIVMRKSFFKQVCNYISPTFYNEYKEKKFPMRTQLSENDIHKIENYLTNISFLPPQEDERAMTIAKIICVLLFDKLLSLEKVALPNYPEWLKALLKRFNDPHYFTQGLPKITEKCHYSQTHIGRVFKQYMHMTMTDYLNQVRLDYAANLLTSSQEPIARICMNSGFASIAYFNTIFKKKYGITPRAFRNRHSPKE